ncbi:hypothetical protein BN424_2169 [Carnobacterium maltaromaticum LMA28]|uniref:Uncharacterized protein n=1 Tax=Carnobacterium maltaromaticum LMA28 TaxID=1234679 RepID=K8E4Z8_CARML|nr:hypothetical protein [Carnobacterium maltaromaticum]CCO11609.2 hypothetical protein BN424_2169 [Carnobacterium maltaromaticum LMA28]
MNIIEELTQEVIGKKEYYKLKRIAEIIGNNVLEGNKMARLPYTFNEIEAYADQLEASNILVLVEAGTTRVTLDWGLAN